MKKGIGISIIVVALLLSLISPFTSLLIGLPIFVLGVILLWFSKSSKKTKTIWTIAPLIIWYPLTVIWLFVYNTIGFLNAQKRDFYVNYDFKGTFTVVESKCGTDPIFKDKRLQFEIPLNGVYLHNGELKSGHIDERVFKKNKDGTLTELKNKFRPTKDNQKDSSGNEKIIGALYGSYGTSINSNGQASNLLSRYIETNKIYSEKEQWQLNKKRDQIIDSLINNCR